VKSCLTLAGLTIDSRLCISGVFKLQDTYGIPLPITLTVLAQRGLVVSWVDYWDDAMRAGWSEERARICAETALVDVYGREYAHQVLSRLDLYSSFLMA